MWVPFLRPFPGNEAQKLFSGSKMGVLSGGQKVWLKKFTCFFGPLETSDRGIGSAIGEPESAVDRMVTGHQDTALSAGLLAIEVSVIGCDR